MNKLLRELKEKIWEYEKAIQDEEKSLQQYKDNLAELDASGFFDRKPQWKEARKMSVKLNNEIEARIQRYKQELNNIIKQ